MADFEPPSFSLGLDLDSQPQPRPPTAAAACPNPNPSPQSQDSPVTDASVPPFQDLYSLPELERAEVEDSDVEPEPSTTRVLKRLRRGPVPRPTTQSLSSSLKKHELERTCGTGDDEIEDFSSPEDLISRRDEHPSTQHHSVCSSSKFPLQGHAILTTKSSSQLKAAKREQASDLQSASLATGHKGLMFPKLTISPLRRFQLPDSDSDCDHPSVSKDVSKGAHKIDPSSREFESTAVEEQRKVSSTMPQHDKGLMFPKLTSSPPQRFQLLDSDSDSEHPSLSEYVSKEAHRIDPSSKEFESNASEEKRKVSSTMPQHDDLWKDFHPMKSVHIPTPALDEICEEYFSSMKEKNAAHKFQTDIRVHNNNRCHPNMNSHERFEQCCDSSDSLPPAHRYFFHSDPRIHKLVRSRLPNFSPIGAVPDRGNQQPGASVIDYMSQFSKGESSKQKGTQKVNNNKSSTRGRNKSRRSNAEEVLHAAEGWVDPKSSASIPKDAGKRRVHASGQSAGHWYTSPEGKKVYVSKNGQELTGQFAYRLYRKESGAGSRKSKKKTTTSSRKKKTKN